MWGIVQTVLITLVVFGVIITIHELGHFLCAKLFKVKVNEFSFGMGPQLWSRVKGETEYSLRLFPIGGFVAMEGEGEDSADDRAFCNKPAWQRFIILVAGALMNIVLGLILLMVLVRGQELLGTSTIAYFQEGAISSSALQENDKIISINNCGIGGYNDAVFQIIRDQDGVVDFTVLRDGVKTQVDGVTFNLEDYGGTRAIQLDFVFYGVPKTFLSSIQYSFEWTVSIVKQVWYSFLDIITGKFGFSQLSGPVGTATVISEASSMGLRSLVMLIAFLTINVGVFNLLPIPALDGGHLLFILLEMVRRKPINPKYENFIHAAGLIFLFGVIILVTFSDITKLITG